MCAMTVGQLRSYLEAAIDQFYLDAVLVKIDGHALTNAKLVDGIVVLSNEKSFSLPICSGLLLSYLDDLVKVDLLLNQRPVQINDKPLIMAQVVDRCFVLEGEVAGTQMTTGVGDYIRTVSSMKEDDSILVIHSSQDLGTVYDALKVAEDVMLRDYSEHSDYSSSHIEVIAKLFADISKQISTKIKPIPPRGEPTRPFRLV